MTDSNFPHEIANDIIEGSATNHSACGSVWILQKHQEDIAALNTLPREAVKFLQLTPQS